MLDKTSAVHSCTTLKERFLPVENPCTLGVLVPRWNMVLTHFCVRQRTTKILQDTNCLGVFFRSCIWLVFSSSVLNRQKATFLLEAKCANKVRLKQYTADAHCFYGARGSDWLVNRVETLGSSLFPSYTDIFDQNRLYVNRRESHNCDGCVRKTFRADLSSAGHQHRLVGHSKRRRSKRNTRNHLFSSPSLDIVSLRRHGWWTFAWSGICLQPRRFNFAGASTQATPQHSLSLSFPAICWQWKPSSDWIRNTLRLVGHKHSFQILNLPERLHFPWKAARSFNHVQSRLDLSFEAQHLAAFAPVNYTWFLPLVSHKAMCSCLKTICSCFRVQSSGASGFSRWLDLDHCITECAALILKLSAGKYSPFCPCKYRAIKWENVGIYRPQAWLNAVSQRLFVFILRNAHRNSPQMQERSRNVWNSRKQIVKCCFNRQLFKDRVGWSVVAWLDPFFSWFVSLNTETTVQHLSNLRQLTCCTFTFTCTKTEQRHHIECIFVIQNKICISRASCYIPDFSRLLFARAKPIKLCTCEGWIWSACLEGSALMSISLVSVPPRPPTNPNSSLCFLETFVDPEW